MKRKNLDKQHQGGIEEIIGNRYEANFFVKKMTEMLIGYGIQEKIIEVKRQKSKANIDDVYYKTDKNSEYFCQCRKYSSFDRQLSKDFLDQFNKNRNYRLRLVTQTKPKVLDKLVQDARKYNRVEFVDRLNKNTQLGQHKNRFYSLCSVIVPMQDKKEKSEEKYIYEFLNLFSIELFDDLEPDEKIKNQLVQSGYSVKKANIIYGRLLQKAGEYSYQDKSITIKTLQDELKNIGVEYLTKERPLKPVYLPKRKVIKKKGKKQMIHILESPEVRFVEKLSYIVDLISNLHKPRYVERKQALKIIQNDDTLSWHFFRNLKNPDWFPIIKDGLIKSIAEQDIDTATKYQLLNYFELCMDKYSDEIIPLLVKLENNTKKPNILAALVKILAKLRSSKKEELNPLWGVLKRLTEHQHPWVRKEIPDTLEAFAEYDIDRSLELLEKLFLFSPIPRDVTRGSPTLALTFQGKDNENWVFEQAARVLSQLMADHKFSAKAFNLAIKLEIKFIKQRRERLKKVSGMTLDYSYIWLADKDPLGKLEFKYDRRERLALEIEKCLDKIAISEVELAKGIFTQLLQANYEVFHLAAIKVLTWHPEEYLDLIEGIVFNEDLWVINNIQNYFLQLLIQKYFELKQNRLREYIQSVKSLNYKNNPRMTDNFKQKLLTSIPENIRTEDGKQELKKLEERLKVPARIEKSFITTSALRIPRPGIEITGLKMKTTDELIRIMEDCTRGRSRVDSYDLSSVFSELISDNPDQLPSWLDKMANKEIDQMFSGEMMRSYIDVKKTNLQDILNTFWKLQKKDTSARIEVARFLDDECRKKETPKRDNGLLKEIKNILFDLASDRDPENDETIKSSNPRPEDAITRGINSVRGVATEALVALLHYFPKDKEIIDKLKTLAHDKTKAVKATLIYNLKYLISKNYPLCKHIVNQFRSERDPEIDFALIHYFTHLDPRKFQANKDFVKLLFTNPHKEIQGNLGELIGHRYVSGFNLEQLVEAIVKQQIGETETRRSLAFVFESRFEEQIAIKKHQRILKYFIKLLDPRIEPDFEVRERTAFALERDELQTQHFDLLYSNKIFDTLIRDKLNIRAQSHLIHYLHRCIFNNESINRSIEILHSQVMEIEDILNDSLIVKDITEILERVFTIQTLDKKTRDLSDQIFDKGLEKGWDEFYEIFQELN